MFGLDKLFDGVADKLKFIKPREKDGENHGIGQIDKPLEALKPRPRIVSNGSIPAEAEPNYPGKVNQLQRKISTLTDKEDPDYIPIKNTNSNVKGRIIDILREAAVGAGRNAAAGGNWGEIAGGAIAGGIGGGIKPTMHEERLRNREIGETEAQIEQTQKVADWLEKNRRQVTDRNNIETDNRLREQTLQDNRDYRDKRLQQDAANRRSIEDTARMRSVASMINKQPYLNVSDPNQADLVEAAKAAGLPITDRNAKLTQKPVQDAETGEWSVVITNPYDPTAKPVAIPVTLSDDGKRFVSTSNAKVIANAANQRQESQQNFTIKRDQIAQQMRVEMENLKNANAMTSKAIDIQAKEAAQRREAEIKERLLKLRQEYDQNK